MSDSLKQKTRTSLLWNTVDKIGFQAVAFVVNLITARILDVEHFALLGALALFTALGNIMVESGFVYGLIRRKQVSREEYSAVFFCNLAVSTALYTLLFFLAGPIAGYFRMPQLKSLSYLLFLSIPISAFGFIQQVRLSRKLRFKPLSLANLFAATGGGAAAVVLAVMGYGYWALAWQIVLQALIRVTLLWYYDFWSPSRHPRWAVIREIFTYSGLLLLTNVMNNLAKYLYNLVIGRRYTVELGYYSQAQKYEAIPSSVISTSITGVAFPVLSALEGVPERRLQYLRKFTRIAAFLTFPILMGFWIVAPQAIQILIGEKWLPSVPYLRMLLLSALFLPFQSLFLNALNACGRSNLSLRCEALRNILTIAVIFPASGNIMRLLLFYTIATAMAFLNTLWHTSRQTGYTPWLQFKDVGPYAFLSGIMCLICWGLNHIPLSLYLSCTLQIAVGALFYLLTARALQSRVLQDVIDLIKNRPMNIDTSSPS